MPKGTTTIYEYADRILKRLDEETATYTNLQKLLDIPSGTMSKVIDQLTREKLIEKIIVENTPHYHTVKDSPLYRILDFLYSTKIENTYDAKLLLTKDFETSAMFLGILIANLRDNSYDITCHIIKTFLQHTPGTPPTMWQYLKLKHQAPHTEPDHVETLSQPIKTPPFSHTNTNDKFLEKLRKEFPKLANPQIKTKISLGEIKGKLKSKALSSFHAGNRFLMQALDTSNPNTKNKFLNQAILKYTTAIESTNHNFDDAYFSRARAYFEIAPTNNSSETFMFNLSQALADLESIKTPIDSALPLKTTIYELQKAYACINDAITSLDNLRSKHPPQSSPQTTVT